MIRWGAGRRVLALDVPSGLELSSGTLHTEHVRAEATMTLAAPKTALAVADVTAAVGRLLLADISVPALVYERLGLAHATPFTRGSVVELVANTLRTKIATGSPAERVETVRSVPAHQDLEIAAESEPDEPSVRGW